MLAPMIRLMPAAIEKNETREEMSRIVGEEVKSTLQHGPDLARGKKFPFTKSARPQASVLPARLGTGRTIPCPFWLKAFERWELGL